MAAPRVHPSGSPFLALSPCVLLSVQMLFPFSTFESKGLTVLPAMP